MIAQKQRNTNLSNLEMIWLQQILKDQVLHETGHHKSVSKQGPSRLIKEQYHHQKALLYIIITIHKVN